MFFGFPAEKTRHPRNYSIQIRNPEFIYDLKTNSQGLRYREVSLRKPGLQFRMLVLGDSFTEGFGVGMNQAFPAVLERLASAGGSGVEFINAGISTFNVADYRRLLLDLGLSYEQDGVLIGVYKNDLSGRGSGAKHRWKILHKLWPRTYTALEERYRYIRWASADRPASRSLDFVLEEARKNGIPEKRISSWLEFLRQQTLVDFEDALLIAPQYYKRALLNPTYFVDNMDIRTEKAHAKWVTLINDLKGIIEYCRENRLWVGVVYLPSYVQYDHNAVAFWRRAGFDVPDKWLTEEPEIARRLSAWSQARKVPFLSLTDAFQKAPKDTPYKYNWPADGHWNAAGHEVAALSIYRWLSQIGVVRGADKPLRPFEDRQHTASRVQ